MDQYHPQVILVSSMRVAKLIRARIAQDRRDAAVAEAERILVESPEYWIRTLQGYVTYGTSYADAFHRLVEAFFN